MEVKKAIRKVVALGTGATMVGATLFSAAAADLSAFPAPFVKDGVFDALIVVGAKAASEDVVGAVDIGASMQFELKKEESVSVGIGEDVVISSGTKIKGTGSEVLNYNESIGEVRTTALDDQDMPVTLAEGRYTESEGNNDNDETYTQTVVLNDTNGIAIMDQPDDGYDMDDYLKLLDSEPVFIFELEFDDEIEYDNSTQSDAADDLEGTELEIQGNIYTITDVQTDAGVIDEMTMMAGETLLWLTQDQVITKTVAGVDHEVKVVDVTDDEDDCGVSVDGDLAWISVGSSKTINGVKIGVLDAKAVHAQLQDVDVCEINVGATEIVLKDGDRLEKDGEDIRNADVEIGDNGGEWTGFTIEVTPDDDVFLAKDDEWVDPALGNIKFVMGGVVTPREDIKIEASGSKDAEITFTNNDGKTVKVPLQIDTNGDGNVTWGTADDKPVLFDGDTFDCGATSEDCDGVMLFAVTSGSTAHVLEITDVDSNRGELDLKDLTYGRSWSDKEYTTGVASVIDLGSLGEIQLTLTDGTGVLDATDLTAITGGAGYSESNYGAWVNLTQTLPNVPSNSTTVLSVIEDDVDDDDIDAQTINVSIGYDADSDKALEVSLEDTGFALSENVNSNDKVDGDSDVQVYSTAHGTVVEADEEDYDYVLIQYPKEEVEVNVFVAPVSAQISTTGGGAVTTVTLPKLNVGAARLDSEISSVSADNLIVVGGPCANKVAADVMGVPYAAEGCDAGFTQGKALIKLYETGAGNVAMIVAGMSAMDTRRATRVVANSDAYTDDLVGTEVVVSGTSLTDIKVSAPQ